MKEGNNQCFILLIRSSMAGDRDSEIAVYIESPTISKRLVTELWAEHLGGDQVAPYGPPHDMKIWRTQAEINSHVYATVFGEAIPEGIPQSAHRWGEAVKEVESDMQHRTKEQISNTAYFLDCNIFVR